MRKKHVIAMLGTAGAGKDTGARFVQEYLSDTALLGFADPLKEFAQAVFEFEPMTLYGSSEKRNEVFVEWASDSRWIRAEQKLQSVTPEWTKRVRLTYYDSPEHKQLQTAVHVWFASLRSESLGRGLSARRMLQTLGTECGRAVDADIWARYGFNRASNFLLNDYRCAIITDCRFVNEARIAFSQGHQVWFIDRPSAGLEGENGKHSSEAEVRSFEMRQYITHTVTNNGTLDDFRLQLAKLVDNLYER